MKFELNTASDLIKANKLSQDLENITKILDKFEIFSEQVKSDLQYTTSLQKSDNPDIQNIIEQMIIIIDNCSSLKISIDKFMLEYIRGNPKVSLEMIRDLNITYYTNWESIINLFHFIKPHINTGSSK
jgi:competence protein ComGF